MLIEMNHEYLPESTSAIVNAQISNKIIKFPEDTQVFIDIDTIDQYDKCLKQIAILSDYISFTVDDSISKSGHPHRHIILTFKESMSIWQRLALQASLGSDLVRELLGCIMVMNNDPHPILFIEEPTQDGKNPSRT